MTKKINFEKIRWVYTDHYKAYGKLIPQSKHIQSKAKTYTVEGYNGILRHSLARLTRRTKCYSKCVKMLEYSVALLMNKWNSKKL